MKLSDARPSGARSDAHTDAASPMGSFGAWLRYFLWLGITGFGGPVALVGYMQRDLVERRQWVTETEYTEGLALAQLAPGPLAAQLAIYLGWVRARVLGATLVGIAFVGPSFVMVIALAALYVRYGGLPWMSGAFYGIGAAVIAIIARSVIKLGKLTLRHDIILWGVAVGNAFVTAWTSREIIWIVLASGVVVLCIRVFPRVQTGTTHALVPTWLTGYYATIPDWLVTGVHGAASSSTVGTIFRFFATAGLVVFGSGLAIVPFLYGGVVQQLHWLTERQFVDAVAIAMITPGPVVITVAFVGYLVAGPIGAIGAAMGVFLPVYLIVVLVAPYFQRIVKYAPVHAFVAGVTAAATGALAGATLVLARRAIVDVPTILIGIVTMVVLLRIKRVPEPIVILAAGIVGMLLTASPLRAQSPTCAATATSLTPAGWEAPAMSEGGTITTELYTPRPGTAALTMVRDIPVPGPAQRFDYQSLDTATNQLYIAHMGAGRLVVIDTKAQRVTLSVPGFEGATGVLAVPALHRVYVSTTGTHEVAVVETAPDRAANRPIVRVVARIRGPQFPDGIAYVPGLERVFVSDESGEAETVIDARTNTLLRRIPLEGEIGNTHYDAVSHCVIAAVQTRNQLVAIDPSTLRVVARYALPGSDHPHGFILDERRRRAFVTGEENATLLTVDLRSMRVIATHRVGDDPDVVALDPTLGRLYVAAESGRLTIFDVRGPIPRPLGELQIPHAHSVAVDPRTHLVYLPLQAIDGHPVVRVMQP